jgi:uncharacterized membrane protein YgaE (UPF0421/DUF939 family)
MEEKNLNVSTEEQETEKKKNPLLSENPVVIAQKEKMATYLNQHSKQVFIIMIVLIAISVIISIYMSLSRERQDFKPSEVKTNIENTTGREVQHFNKLMNDYDRLKEKEAQADKLIEAYEKEALKQKEQPNK